MTKFKQITGKNGEVGYIRTDEKPALKFKKVSATDKINMARNDPTVRNLTKLILTEATDKDCVDAYYDVLLAAKLLKNRMDENLKY